MTQQQDVIVKLDDRIRFMSAVLAATDWPEQAQARHPHGTHAHARGTRRFLQAYQDHDAVKTLQSLLDNHAPLEAMFTFVLLLGWPDLTLETDRLPGWVPPRWIPQLRDFLRVSHLTEWWAEEDAVWQRSLKEAGKMFDGVAFKPFLEPFVGPVREDLIYVPNISYPADQEIGLRIGTDLICVAPPRLAWGDSPPWPFDEDPAHIYRGALTEFGRLLLLAYLRTNTGRVAEAAKTPMPVSEQFQALHATWEDQFITLFVAAAVAIYLEDHVNKAEANAYVLMARKAQGMTILPGTVSVLRRYLSERESGRYESLLDFLPIFPKQLRIAKKIVTL